MLPVRRPARRLAGAARGRRSASMRTTADRLVATAAHGVVSDRAPARRVRAPAARHRRADPAAARTQRASPSCARGSTGRYGSRSPARSRRGSRRCSTRSSARRSRRRTPASAPASSRGTATATCTASPRCRTWARRSSCGSGAPRGAGDRPRRPAAPSELRYLDVEWPSERLRDMVLIDTPGLASISDDVSRRTERFLASDEEGPGDADAVIYLMRHLHPMDLSFLEAFQDTHRHPGASVNSIAVLSRADEIGAAGPNALQAAERVAARYRARPTHRLAVPGRRPGRRAHRPGGGRAARGRGDRAADARRARPRARPPSCCCRPTASSRPRHDRPAIDPAMRQRLLDRLGLFGVRLAVELLVAGRVDSAGDARHASSSARSGIMRAARRPAPGSSPSRAAVLKARSTLATVSALADAARRSARAGCCATWCATSRTPPTSSSRSACSPAAERPVRARRRRRRGATAARRRRSRPARPPRAAADGDRQTPSGRRPSTTISRWRMLAEDPLMVKDARDIAHGVIRTCEELAVGR